ncbi:PREDICTED: B3 domain-containing protein At1g05920-like [Erythranthe guttata]|uniref:B3 domain-containing protein At1g05920-like n=1 Tax=Erythranthe guttata TaxID=4155 RepID=UPI00064DDD99|nr:PREDICTED: B3 domain-containing protein At1g05920-like [Erythranthe guttata]|eukprot:XP_012827442.1 PREDICTED: B3 domain-containing protein At1g05920-like [Erythranthe guttata]
MACRKFRRDENNRFKTLARLANQRLHELMEADEMKKKKNRNKRKFRSKPVFEIPDDFVDWEVEYEEQQEQEEEEEEYSDRKGSAAKRRKSSSNNNSPKKKKESSGEGLSSSQPPPRPLPEEFKEVIRRLAQGGKRVSEEKLVIEKGLFKTDLAKGNNRLSIPFTQVLDHTFLTDEETHFLTTRDGNNKMNFKEVTIIEPSLELEKVKLCRWDMNKANGKNTSSNYVLNGAWSNVAQRNHLEPDDVVQLWSFRIDQELHLALVKIPHNENN